MALDLGSATFVGGVQVQVILDPIALNFLLKSPRGPVGLLIISLAERTVAMAKVMAPVKTGRLRSSISLLSVTPTPAGVEARVVVNVNYAQAVHFGLRGGRTIEAKSGSVLKFPGSGGATVYRRQVTQGATKPNPFFWRALLRSLTLDPRVKVLSATFDPGTPL